MTNERPYDDAFGNWLRRAMATRRLGVRQAAKYIGVSASTLSAQLNGETYPSLDTVRKMAEYFRVPEQEILRLLPGYRRAADVPPADERADPELAEIMRDLERGLTPEERQSVKDFALFVLEMKRRRGTNAG